MRMGRCMCLQRVFCWGLFLLLFIPTAVAASQDQITFGGDLLISPGEKLSGDVVIFGGQLEIMGELQGNAVAIGGLVRIQGKITGDLTAVGSRVELLEEANITGDVKIISGSISRKPNVRIGGSYSHITPIPQNIRFLPRSLFQVPFLFPQTIRLGYPRFMNIMLSFFFQLLLVLLISYLFPQNVKGVASSLKENLGHSLLIGFIGLLVLIPLMIFLTITILGIPLALLTPVLYWMAITLGRTGIYLSVGTWAQRYVNINKDNLISTTVMGLLVYFLIRLIIRYLPFIGAPIAGMISFLLYLLALGSTLQSRFGTGEPWFKRHA